MGLFDKMIDAMKLDDDDDEYDDYDDAPEKKKRGFFKKANEDEDVVDEPSGARASKSSDNVVSWRRPPKRAQGSGREVCVIKPTSFEEVKEIAETLLAERIVILNMEGLDLAVAQRIIDFMSGACYAIDGNLQKVSTYIFILTPKNVDLSGDLQGIMDSFEFGSIGLQS